MFDLMLCKFIRLQQFLRNKARECSIRAYSLGISVI